MGLLNPPCASPVRVRQHKKRRRRRGREGEDTTTMMFFISSSECTAAAHRTRVTRTMEAPYEEEGEEAEQLQS